MDLSVFKQLSIIIPVGPDDSSWKPLIAELSEFGVETEIILAACELKPNNIELPDHVQWINTDQGRAKQLNAGAKQASRHFIWFLHADTRLLPHVVSAVRQYIDKADNNLGYFKLRFAMDGPKMMAINAWAANIRSTWFGLPFGDQGFITNKLLFDKLNGYDEQVLLGEDLDFVVRLKSRQGKLQQLPAELITSARRYQQYGWFMTTIRYVGLTWLLTYQAKQRIAESL